MPTYTKFNASLLTSFLLFATPVVESRELDTESIYEASKDAIVYVVATNKKGETSSFGTGFFIDKQGLILTNEHVIPEANTIYIYYKTNGKTVPAILIASDKNADIALLKTSISAPFLPLDISEVRIGQKIIAIGNPKGLSRTISTGIVSSLRDDDGINKIQITAPISSGSSGGPLINEDGKAIGITTEGLVDAQNLNFAIPVSYISKLKKGKFTYLLKNNMQEPELPTTIATTGISNKPLFPDASAKLSITSHKNILKKDTSWNDRSKAKAWYEKTKVAVQAEMWSEVIRTSNVASNLHPQFIDPYIDRSVAYISLGFMAKARDDLAIALMIDNKNPSVNNNLGVVYQDAGHLDQATKFYETSCFGTFQLGCDNFKAISGYYPADKSEYFTKKSSEYFDAGEYDLAYSFASEAIATDIANVRGFIIRSAAATMQDRLEQGLSDASKAIELDPDSATAYNNKGFALHKMGHLNDAKLEYYISCGMGFELACKNLSEIE
ncbi:MAG: trypsin-like peptidase domain-containing protein [Motiliproteus sp.]